MWIGMSHDYVDIYTYVNFQPSFVFNKGMFLVLTTNTRPGFTRCASCGEKKSESAQREVNDKRGKASSETPNE